MTNFGQKWKCKVLIRKNLMKKTDFWRANAIELASMEIILRKRQNCFINLSETWAIRAYNEFCGQFVSRLLYRKKTRRLENDLKSINNIKTLVWSINQGAYLKVTTTLWLTGTSSTARKRTGWNWKRSKCLKSSFYLVLVTSYSVSIRNESL